MAKITLDSLPLEVRMAVEFMHANPPAPFRTSAEYRRIYGASEAVIIKFNSFQDDDRYAVSARGGSYAVQKAWKWARQFFPEG